MSGGIIFSPADEPYRGRSSLLHFDQMLVMAYERGAEIAPLTSQSYLNRLARALVDIVPLGVSIAASIRELVRQAYLPSGIVLLRPLVERAAVANWLLNHEDDLLLWESGWSYKKRPSLRRMLRNLNPEGEDNILQLIVNDFNSTIHAEPAGSRRLTQSHPRHGRAYSMGKVTNEPDLCDKLCFTAASMLIVLMAPTIVAFDLDNPLDPRAN